MNFDRLFHDFHHFLGFSIFHHYFWFNTHFVQNFFSAQANYIEDCIIDLDEKVTMVTGDMDFSELKGQIIASNPPVGHLKWW